MTVNHTPNKALVNNKFVPVDRGETLTSKLKLAKRWGWSRKKLDNFLLLLENDKMAHTESTPHYTTIKVLNYAQYQTNKNNLEQHYTQPTIQQKSNGSTQISNDIINSNENKERIDYVELKTYYNSFPNLPNIRSLSVKRKDAIKLRVKEVGIEDFKDAIKITNDTPFLNGTNEREWVADIDWLIANDTNILKVLENKYGKKVIEQNNVVEDYLFGGAK